MDAFYEKLKTIVSNPGDVELLKNQDSLSYLNSDRLCVSRLLDFINFSKELNYSKVSQSDTYRFYIDLNNVLTEIRIRFKKQEKNINQNPDIYHDSAYNKGIKDISVWLNGLYEVFERKDLIYIEHERNCIAHSVSQDMYKYYIEEKLDKVTGEKTFTVKTKVYSKILKECLQLSECLKYIKDFYHSFGYGKNQNYQIDVIKLFNEKHKSVINDILKDILSFSKLLESKNTNYLIEQSIKQINKET